MVGGGSTCGLSHVSSDYLHSQAALDFILLQTSCSVKVWGSFMVEEKCFLGKPGNKRKAKLICSLVQASSVLLCQVLQEWEWLRWREEFICIHFCRFLLQWWKKLKAEIPSLVSDPKSVGGNTQARRDKGQVQHFTAGSGWSGNETSSPWLCPSSHLELGFFYLYFSSCSVNSPGWGDGVFWTVAVAVLPKMSSTRIACSPKYKWSLSSKSYKSSFACGAHARWKVPLWFPPNTRAAAAASPLFFPNEIFRSHLLTHAL